MTLVETSHVAGGDSDSLDEVVVSATRLKPQSLDLQSLQDHLDRQMGLQHWYFYGGAGGGGEAIDNTPGYPVEHQKGLGISDYQEAWQKLLSKMSAAELTAFSGALAKAAADAKGMKEKGASDRLAQLAAAVLVGDSIGAAFASNQASDNLRGKSMALFEGLITKAYAAAAALPGGI